VSLWNSTLVYVGARTLLAAAMIMIVLRRRHGPWFVLGQIVSDLSCAAFLLAYVNADIREDVGVLVIPLLLFVCYWELARFLDERKDRAEQGSDDESFVDSALRAYGTVWLIGFVVPAVLASGFVVLEVLAPNQWPFPNPRAPLVCAPRLLQPGDVLTLRMSVPHGGELSVFTPAGQSLVVMPFVAKGTEPEGAAFRDIERLSLRADTVTGRISPSADPQLVFTDSGVYVLRVSEEAEVSPSRVCRVRLVRGAGAGGPGTRERGWRGKWFPGIAIIIRLTAYSSSHVLGQVV